MSQHKGLAKPTTDLNWRGHLYFDREDVEQANNNYTYFVKDLHKGAVDSFSPISEGRMFDFYPLIFLPNDSKLPGQTLQELRNPTLQWDEKSEEANCLGSYLGQAFEQVRAEVRTAKRKATPSSLAKLERKEPSPGKAPTTKKVESSSEELPEGEQPPPKSEREEAPKLVNIIYQQLLSNKD